MKRLVVLVMAVVMMLMLVTACNNKPVDCDNEIKDIMVETGITVAEESKVTWIRQSFLTDDRLRSLTMALESMEYRKAHGELVTSVKVEEDDTWHGWYRASFSSTITIAE